MKEDFQQLTIRGKRDIGRSQIDGRTCRENGTEKSV